MAKIAGIAARLRMVWMFAQERYLPFVPIANTPTMIARERI
jgi:hypothetical protein